MLIESNLAANQLRKVALLITAAAWLGMDVSGYGQADENKSSGYVYLWLEDYPFTLFIGPSGDEVCAIWTNSEDGEEHECELGNLSLDDLYVWVNQLEQASEDSNDD